MTKKEFLQGHTFRSDVCLDKRTFKYNKSIFKDELLIYYENRLLYIIEIVNIKEEYFTLKTYQNFTNSKYQVYFNNLTVL